MVNSMAVASKLKNYTKVKSATFTPLRAMRFMNDTTEAHFLYKLETPIFGPSHMPMNSLMLVSN